MSRAYNELLHIKQLLENIDSISTHQAHFLIATQEYLSHFREQMLIHDGYCCSCGMFTRLESSSSSDDEYENTIP